MKRFLLFCLAITCCQMLVAQTYNISAGTLPANSVQGDPVSGYTDTYVSGTTTRPEKVTYYHRTPIFSVQSGWITPFNSGAARDTTNADYFEAQGNNTISSPGEALIIFDTVYFNNGAGNRMDISSYNGGFFSADNSYGQSPGAILVTRRLEFNNGITSTNRTYPVSGAIVFSNSANYTGGNTDAQHVDGFVSEVNYPTGTTPYGHGGDFTFPVGNATEIYAVRRQGSFSSTDHTLTIGWIDGDPGSTPDPTVTSSSLPIHPIDWIEDPSIVAISPLGFWDWHYQTLTGPTTAPQSMPSDQTVTVSLPNLSDLPMLASELRLMGWDEENQWWINLSGTTGASGLTKGSTLTGVIPGGTAISALAIGSTNTALPVTFGTFKVSAQGCKALLNWQTTFEQNNKHFKVERSANGRDFTTIAEVQSAGNGTSLRNYQYTDLTPLEGVNYYRITQVDFDGKQTSTGIQTTRIQCNGVLNVKVFPNPARQQVNVLTGKAVAQVNVINAAGQSVVKYAPSVNQGGTFSLNISNITSGIYFLQVINKDGTIDLIKFFKE